MNFTIAIEGGESYDLKSETGRIASLEVYNEGPGDLYYGDVPGPTLLSEAVGYSDGAEYVDLLAPPAGITEGMLVTSSEAASIDPGTAVAMVTGVPGQPGMRRIYLTAPTVTAEEGVGLSFIPPPIDATTGIPILVGGKEVFTGADGNWLSQSGLRLWAEGGNVTVRIRKKFH